MISKKPVFPDRIRCIPGQFSWVDHRLVRDGHIDQCCHGASALYLFLITVSDARGLSYYSDATLMRRLHMDEVILEQSRRQLIHLDLIAYKKPIYQVLPLSEGRRFEETPARSPGSLRSMEEIFKQMTGSRS